MRLALFALFTFKVVASVKVLTPFGEIEGSTDLVTRRGKTIYSFRGIRFAKAPINELRFMPPVPLGRWSGTYDATKDGAACPQPPVASIPMSEDCLFLNIYTTKIPGKWWNPKRPVVVYLHGGGFYLGTGHSAIIGPQYMADEPIVLVTLNYRLGSLGFLAVNKEVPGNNGLRDQVVALRWIKRNILAFGGDPNSITIFGFSAGSCSVTLHLVSKMSRGLFNRAIASSCSVFGNFPLPRLQVALAQKQARFVGCPDDTPEAIIKCLRNKTAEEIAATVPQFAEFGHLPPIYWSPVIEKDFGQDRFLCEHPIKSVLSGRFEQVPVLAGITRDDFADPALEIINNKTLLQELNDNFNKWAPVIFNTERDSERSEEISTAIKYFYFDGQPIEASSLSKLFEAFTDSLIGFGTNRLVELVSNKSSKSVYYYEFSYEEIQSPFGVGHSLDQMYLFKTSQPLPIPVPPTFPNATVVETMVCLWSNFARTGNPNIPSRVSRTIWPRYNTITKKYLDIGEKLVVRDHLFQERYDFWAGLYPISSYLE